MPLDKKALKAKLLSHYSARLDDVLEQVADEKRLNISEIEEIALNLRQEVGENVTESLAEHESNQEEVDIICSSCQQKMRNKGRKAKWVKTQSGTIQMKRSYYYCPECQAGHFPPR